MTAAGVRVPLGVSREEWTTGTSPQAQHLSHRSQQNSTGEAQRGRLGVDGGVSIGGWTHSKQVCPH